MRSIRAKIEAVCWPLLVAGCSLGVAPPLGERRDVPPQRGGVLRTASYAAARGLDPVATFDTASSALDDLLYDTLVSYDAQGRIVPQLAESFEVSPDGKRYVFTLRRGVRFHDGVELLASDVKRSMERALHPDTPCPVPSFYARLRGYHEFHDGKASELSGIQVDGDYVVRMELTEPDATFLFVLALPTVAPLCRSAGHRYDRNFSLSACGAGPFKLQEFKQNQIVRVVRHEAYWQKGKPYLDGITWYLPMQQITQRFKFETGEIDYMRDFSEADSVAYRSDPRWRGHGAFEPATTTGGLFMNAGMPPFDNRHLRRAVAFALDRTKVAALRPVHVQAQNQVVPEVILKLPAGTKLQRHDPARALEEMRLAGYAYDPSTGKGGYPEEIPYLINVDSFGVSAAELYQQELARIGIRIRLQAVGWPTFLARTSRPRTTPMGYTGWAADYPEPSDFYEPLFTTGAIQEEESQNASFFSNAEFDRVVAQARRSTDPAERVRLYQRAEEILAAEAPWAVGYSVRYFELWQPYVHGYAPHPVLQQHLRFVWLDLEQQRRVASAGKWWLPPHRRGQSRLAALLGVRP